MKAEEQKLKQQKESCSVSVASNVLPVSFMYSDFGFLTPSGVSPESESEFRKIYIPIEPMTEKELDQRGEINF
jgi:hypothetical protein